MDLWYTEYTNKSSGLTIKIERQLDHRKTEFQTIDIFKTHYYGNLMVIDGVVMLTEFDEFIYHESLVHVPMQFLQNPKNVLIIGGGDGGTAREVLKYGSIEEVVMVEIDREVCEVSKKYFPNLSVSFKDKRLKLIYDDGAKYVKDTGKKFDLIIIDSTDPVGPGEVLFTEEFYRNCSNILKDFGILTAQTESPFDREYRDPIKRIYRNLRKSFKNVNMYLGHIPTYPFGTWSFAFASNSVNPVSDNLKNSELPEGLKYYNRELGKSAFILPNFVRDLINE